jgi:ABC-2 type transport system permease protein
MVPTLLLSGMFFSIDNMPLLLQWLSMVFPARWFISAVKKVMIEGSGVAPVLKEMSILAGMVVVLLSLSIAKIKNRLE